jgi:hypothetical protein
MSVTSPGSSPAASRCSPPRSSSDGSPPAALDGTACLAYPRSLISPKEEQDLRLLHLENGAWSDGTSAADPGSALVCGRADSLAWFAIARSDPSPFFNRGDFNDGSLVDISGPIATLGLFFLGEETIPPPGSIADPGRRSSHAEP